MTSETSVLVDALIESPAESARALALLRVLRSDVDKRVLFELLENKDDRIAKVAAWIVSELGSHAEPLYPGVLVFLSHRADAVRFWLIDCVSACGRPSDGEHFARVLSMIADPAASVRWKAMMFAYRAPTHWLRAVLTWLETTEGQSGTEVQRDASLRQAVQEMLSVLEGITPCVQRWLAHNDPLFQRYAVVALARGCDRAVLLKESAVASDPEAQQFVSDVTSLGPRAMG